MIKSLQFTGKGKNDYITRKDCHYVKRDGISDEEYERVRHETHARGPKWERVAKLSPEYNVNPHLIKNLLNHKFEFAPNRINVLFGPNGSGKTTILKAIAAGSMCGIGYQFDGFTNLQCYCPENMNLPWGEEKDFNKALKEALENRAGNQFKLEWDGYPVYYENFASRKSYSFGDLEGGLIEDGLEEMNYILGKDRSSAGQTTIWMINKLTSIAIRNIDINKMFEDVKKRMKHVNDLWSGCYQANLDYFNKFYKEGNEKDNKLTVLLDEMDKSLDINNVVRLYTELFPRLVEKYPIQLILISHSPIILSKNIRENPIYNIISLEEDYTKQCIENLKTINF